MRYLKDSRRAPYRLRRGLDHRVAVERREMRGEPFVLTLAQVRIGRDDRFGRFFRFEEHGKIAYEVREFEIVAAMLSYAPEVAAPPDLQILFGDHEAVVRVFEDGKPARVVRPFGGHEDA